MRTGAIALLVSFLLCPHVVAAEEVTRVCPVTGRPAQESLFLDHGGARHYFSSKAAAMLFKLAPDRYASSQQETCPVMGGAIDKKVFTDHEGRRVFFCCPGCIDTFKANPAKYLAKLAEKGKKKG